MRHDPDIVPQAVPAAVLEILNDQGLTVREAYRNGPRYWVGLVERQGERFILKVVLEDFYWQHPYSGREHRTSHQLLAEARVLDELSAHRHRLAGRIGELVAHHPSEPATWSLRREVAGHDLSLDGHSLQFVPEVFEGALGEKLFNFIRSYQALTPHLPTAGHDTPKSAEYILAAKLMTAGVTHDPSPTIAALAPSISGYVLDRSSWYADAPLVLSHGEPYPTHFLYDGQTLGLIDWENAHRNNAAADLVDVWIRGFNYPEWQAKWRDNLVMSENQMNPRDFELLWDLETVIQASRLIGHIERSPEYDDSDRLRIIAALKQQLLAILSKG